MQTVADLEHQAMALPDADRARLAAYLLKSLPAILWDDDDGLAEAQRRDAEIDRDPKASMTMEELRHSLKREG
jgi:hypothetical protein